MSSTLAHAPAPKVRVRPAERGDVDALAALEHRVFATDRLSRRSLQRFLKSPAADVLVAQDESGLVGNAIVLFRPRSLTARLYSIAVAPHMGGRGVGTMLLAAAEAAALARGCRAIRLAVHVTKPPGTRITATREGTDQSESSTQGTTITKTREGVDQVENVDLP